MNKEELEKEATEFEESHTVYQVAKRQDGSDYAKKVCNITVKDAYLAGAEPREKQIADLEAQIEKMKKYIKTCWVEENLNDYSSYITNTSNEFRDLVKELNEEIRNGR